MRENYKPTDIPDLAEGEKARLDLKQTIEKALNKNEQYEFITEEHFDDFLKEPGTKNPDKILRIKDEPVSIPLNMIVGARGFDSWQGRPAHELKDGRASREVINDYATRASDIPGIDMGADMFIYGGRVLLISENAHRVAAAKLKDQKEITLRGDVNVYYLQKPPI